MHRKLSIFFQFIFVIGLSACDDAATSTTKDAPSHVENGIPESEIARISLTPTAVERLGLETVKVEELELRNVKTFGADLIPPPGRSTLISTPFAAAIAEPDGGIPSPGSVVKKGQAIVKLIPFPASSDATNPVDDAAIKKTEYENAKKIFDRLEALLKSKAASQQDLEQARTDLLRSEAAYNSAKAQLQALEGAPQTEQSSQGVIVRAPYDGAVTSLFVAPGQMLSIGAPLFKLEAQSPLWAKVTLFSGEIESVDLMADAIVKPISEWTATEGQIAHPISGPLSSDLVAATIDLSYSIENEEGLFRSGQKVSIDIALKQTGEQKTVPASAIFNDIHGGSWVYRKEAEGSYSRQRVEVSTIVDNVALLAHGPDIGTEVVSVGVAELAGTEFGVGH